MPRILLAAELKKLIDWHLRYIWSTWLIFNWGTCSIGFWWRYGFTATWVLTQKVPFQIVHVLAVPKFVALKFLSSEEFSLLASIHHCTDPKDSSFSFTTLLTWQSQNVVFVDWNVAICGLLSQPCTNRKTENSHLSFDKWSIWFA